MKKILGYIALGIIAAVGLYEVAQLNNVSDVIAEGNIKTDKEIAQRKADKAKAAAEAEAMREDNYAMEDYAVADASAGPDYSSSEAEE
jgi:hypothetical protein